MKDETRTKPGQTDKVQTKATPDRRLYLSLMKTVVHNVNVCPAGGVESDEFPK